MNPNNYIQLSGRLTADVTPNEGKTFARFNLAKNFQAKDGKQTRFFRCVIFKKEFEANQQTIPWDLLTKGQEILLTGKLTPNTWTDKDGAEHQDIEIVVNKIRDLAEE